MSSNHVNATGTGDARTPLLEKALAAIHDARVALNREIGAYPAPIPACDAQFNGLLEERRRLSRAIRDIGALLSHADRHTPTKTDLKRFVDIVRQIDAGLAVRLVAAVPDGPIRRSTPR